MATSIRYLLAAATLLVMAVAAVTAISRTRVEALPATVAPRNNVVYPDHDDGLLSPPRDDGTQINFGVGVYGQFCSNSPVITTCPSE